MWQKVKKKTNLMPCNVVYFLGFHVSHSLMASGVVLTSQCLIRHSNKVQQVKTKDLGNELEPITC